jgi:hypothetical protein
MNTTWLTCAELSVHQKENSLEKYETNRFQWDTFSGRVSTLKQINPIQSTRTTATDEQRIRVGFLATHFP